ncbi:hypothetical protein HPP92_006128 [Vanilla planifolia]|uniref:Uncharacterized protein n=1 Tax=Vanilla planifolia TaxID=51239 RepID=A0A835VD95_VANPL|nr:hypothetical protein HPP92_006128 [Vanilla planifolia]
MASMVTLYPTLITLDGPRTAPPQVHSSSLFDYFLRYLYGDAAEEKAYPIGRPRRSKSAVHKFFFPVEEGKGRRGRSGGLSEEKGLSLL